MFKYEMFAEKDGEDFILAEIVDRCSWQQLRRTWTWFCLLKFKIWEPILIIGCRNVVELLRGRMWNLRFLCLAIPPLELPLLEILYPILKISSVWLLGWKSGNGVRLDGKPVEWQNPCFISKQPNLDKRIYECFCMSSFCAYIHLTSSSVNTIVFKVEQEQFRLGLVWSLKLLLPEDISGGGPCIV